MTPRRPRARRALVALTLAAGLTVGPAVLPATAPLPLAAPAHAIGEEGPFDLPLSTTRTTAARAAVGTFDLTKLLNPDVLATLDTDSWQLSVADGTSDPSAPPTVAPDGRTITVPGQGVWQVVEDSVYFTPTSSATGVPQSVQLTVTSLAGYTSNPITLTVVYPAAPSRSARAAEGETARISLGLEPALVNQNSVAFTLEAMPTGTALSADATELVVPDEGTWRAVGEGEVEFTPRLERAMRQPTPVHYTVSDTWGERTRPGTITLSIPRIAEFTGAEAYGQPVNFSLATYSTNIDFSTLELVPYSEAADTEVIQPGLRVAVRNQGTWSLDRESATLTFTPLSDTVRDVTPIGVRGRDPLGNSSAVVPINVGYPQVGLSYRSFTFGTIATFMPLDGSLHVLSSSFAFRGNDMPAGTEVTDNGLTMIVPGEGTWRMDRTNLEASFHPNAGVTESPTPATYSVSGQYGTNETLGLLEAQYAEAVPIARDEEVTMSSTGEPLIIDVLANDTPASAAQALEPATLQLRSASATNIQDLVLGAGTRLVIPDTGVFEVTDAGAVRFTPVAGFVGRTKPIEYSVQDTRGLRTSARLVVEVDPLLGNTPQEGSQGSGVNALLSQLLPTTSISTFAMFVSITTLLTFTGGVSLWVGRQIERGRADG